ncbi:sporulation integral membrane protein YlbJ [Halobacillus litoralis]|uniref:sporulation integral membrane protein YlbJ n=1 Tax=Halobacillus litoralis TaxID=45668 RepID=UPI001CD2177F|nr:sporulation integral membrane protein YlbJ [Halobacillus litoralis]MCA0969388.1 sporulation integral membrane protein YlbJ [Halobacillus litoralis]
MDDIRSTENRTPRRRKLISKLKTFFLTILTICIAAALIIYPQPALSASLRGLDLWWEVVFPSLLPFFITAELMIGFGVVHGLGALSERLMRPLFNVPGSGGFVWVMGMASGYPAGAKWTADLRKKGQVTRAEAERLVAFTNASSPLFIFGAIAVGFFHDAALGLLIAVCHYGGNFIVGIAMRYYKRSDTSLERNTPPLSWRQAFQTMHTSRLQDGRSVGKLMGDAVTKSVDTLLMVGGFIMLFSVLTELLKQTGMIHIVSHGMSMLLIPETFHIPIVSGMLEMTTGIGSITETNESLLTQLMLVSFLLGFHGFSIQAQIASILAETDIRFKPYAIARIAHGILAALLMIGLFHLYERFSIESIIPLENFHESYVNAVLTFCKHNGPPITILTLGIMVIVKWHRKREKANHYERIS